MTSPLRNLPVVKLDASKLKEVKRCSYRLLEVDTQALVIDTAYQRDVTGAGKEHIERIATDFDFAKFAPLIVAPAGDGLFAIIDGQHRATAARARGLSPLPALVLDLDPRQQAAAFAAINGNVTPISSQHVFKAALAAGEGWARELFEVAAAAQVTILTYPKPRRTIQKGETMAVGALRQALRQYGKDIVLQALKAVTATRHNRPGALNQQVVKALCDAASAFHRAGRLDRLVAAAGRIDLAALEKDSHGGAAEAGISRVAWLTEAIIDELKAVKP